MRLGKHSAVVMAALLSSGLLVLAVCGPGSAPQPESSPSGHPVASPAVPEPARPPAVTPAEPATVQLPSVRSQRMLELLIRLDDREGFPKAWLAPDERPSGY